MKGRPPTDDQLVFLESEPEVDEGIRIMVRAYSELSSCRNVGMGIGPIPWTAMLEWCRHHNLRRDVSNHLINVLRLVDADTLRKAAERAKAKK